MRFTKMQGLGNDYLYVYGEVPQNVAEISKKLSDRHFGAGSDGVIYIFPSAIADFRMRIFNADGSEAQMCGNGIRCVGKYVYDKGYTDKTDLKIETEAGIKKLTLYPENGKVRRVSVEMGKAAVEKDVSLPLCGGTVCTPVSVGNPHAVVFTDDAEKAPVDSLGPRIERDPFFPEGVNVEFVSVKSADRIRMRVWERGSGVTMACGTGACASVSAAVKKGFCLPGIPVSVELDGGVLEITVGTNGAVRMTGPAETVFEGEAEI